MVENENFSGWARYRLTLKKKLELDAAKFEAETQRLEMKANEAMLENPTFTRLPRNVGGLNVQEGENVSQSTLIGIHTIRRLFTPSSIVERDVKRFRGSAGEGVCGRYPDKILTA